MNADMQRKEKVAQVASQWLALKPVFFDTETTGLDGNAEICDIAIVNYDGKVLYNELIKPVIPIPQAAMDVHHITNEMVAGCLGMGNHFYAIKNILTNRVVIAYNADYDVRMLYQAASIAGVRNNGLSWLAVVDAMGLYARFYGSINPKTGTYRWQKLGLAAEQLGIDYDTTLHRALADTELTRQVFLKMSKN